MDTDTIAKIGATPGFVMCYPPGNPIPQSLSHKFGVIGKGVSCFAHQPSTLLMQRQGKIPMIERCDRADIVGQQCVNQPIIEVKPALVDRPGSLRQDAWPGYRETI